MSIAKFVNGGNRSVQKRRELHDYILDPFKTENQTLTGGYAGGRSVEAMEIINRLHHKEGGRQFMQLVVAPTSDTNIDRLKYLEFARYMPLIFPHHQSFYAVHTDTKHLHIHIVYNTVNFITGRKLSIAPSGLSEIRRKINGYLDDFGFAPILEGSGCILDSKDLPNVPGFSRFEIDESLLPPVGTPKPIDIFEDPVIASSYYNNPDYPRGHTTNCFYEDSPVTAFERIAYPKLNLAKVDLPSYDVGTSIFPMPEAFMGVPTPMNGYPTMSMSIGPHIDITADSSSDLSGAMPAIQSAFDEARAQQSTATNIGYAIERKAYQQGIPMNVQIDASPHIHIDLTTSATSADIIDLMPDDSGKTE